jgi:hypothetical protein
MALFPLYSGQITVRSKKGINIRGGTIWERLVRVSKIKMDEDARGGAREVSMPAIRAKIVQVIFVMFLSERTLT